tara:strand:- start:12651 stop:13211 length:561 start_codon:yes stop_codon:yes gene_type:complete
MAKGWVEQIDEQIAYGKMTMIELEEILKELSTAKRSKGNTFQFTEYCSAESYKELTTGADAFDRAMMREVGSSDLEILQRDVREFLHRNHLRKDQEGEFRRCKEGFGFMSGEEYFFYNYCHINGKLPVYRQMDKATFDIEFSKYINECKRVRSYKPRESGNDRDRRAFQRPLTTEECFRLKNKKDV